MTNVEHRQRIIIEAYRAMEAELGWTVTGSNNGMTRKDGTYIMIPFNPLSFAKVADYAHRLFETRRKTLHWNYGSPKFVDVGAGLGFKVKMANHLGFYARGIEYDKRYIVFAKKYLKLDLIYQNALEAQYDEYDVIYFYRPIADETIQAKLEDRIIETMRPGTIIIGVYSTTGFRRKMIEIGNEVFFKKGDEHYFDTKECKAIINEMKEDRTW